MLKDKLIVKRIINNNIIIAEDFKGREVVAIGKGLGFSKRQYDTVNQYEIMKTYMLVDNSKKGQILSLFEQVPFQVIELTQRIIDMAQEELKVTFNVNLVVALADHINFSVIQYNAGLDIPTLFSEEVKRFYKDEYQIGKQAIQMINETLNISIKEEESTSIAFHLITATEKRSNHDALRIMRSVKEIIDIVEASIPLSLDEDSLAYSRFVIHLKFFIRNILFEKDNQKQGSLAPLLSQVEAGYNQANQCVDKISKYVLEKNDYQVTDEDRLYLLIHIIRLLDYQKISQNDLKGEKHG